MGGVCSVLGAPVTFLDFFAKKKKINFRFF
jgi:hypothetical protein